MKFARFIKYAIFFLGVSFIVISQGRVFVVQAANYNSTLNVTLTVPQQQQQSSQSTPGSSTNPPAPTPPAPTPPSISNVVSTPAYTSAVITWSATSTDPITASVFSYGLTTNYGNTGVVSGSYQTNLTGLSTSTLYYFKIVVTNTDSLTATYSGSFSTQTPAPPPPPSPPTISNIAATPGKTSAAITWTTDQAADTKVNYGLTSQYGSTAYNAARTTSHSFTLLNLLPNTTYHYIVTSAAATALASTSTDAVFTTQKSQTAPPDVTNLQLTTSATAIALQWTNPDQALVPDFVGVVVMRKVGSASASVTDGTQLYNGAANNYTDSSAVPGTTYYYTVFSYNTSNNYSSGVFASGKIPVVPPPPPPPKVCGIDLSCSDPLCASDIHCPPPTPAVPPAPLLQPFVPGPTAPGPGGWLNASTTSSTLPASTVPAASRLTINDLAFLAGQENINLVVANNTVSGIAGYPLWIHVPKNKLLSKPVSMVTTIDGRDQHLFSQVAGRDYDTATVAFPMPAGSHNLVIEIDYGKGQKDVLSFGINSQSTGRVIEDSGAIVNATVTLLQSDGSSFPAAQYGQGNPEFTGNDGSYGWMVPVGNYSLLINKKGYFERTTVLAAADINAVHDQVTLIKQPPPLVINPNAPLTENIAAVAQNLAGQSQVAAQRIAQGISDASQLAQTAANNPQVQKVTRQVVAPTAVGVATAGTVAFLSWSELVSLLQLLFLQPLTLLGRRKRERWGQVYNALTKLPVDLATIRLISNTTNKIVQSKVTDRQGRYAFVADPGVYRIQAFKQGLQFPSEMLKELKSDGRRVDIYHGEPITVSGDNTVITANIPLDPLGELKKPLRLIWEKVGRRVQVGVSWVGLVIMAGSLYISRAWYIWVLLGVQIAGMLLFRRLSRPVKIKSWGIVYDKLTKGPVSKVVARLFSQQFNKLVATQVTDNAGRYYFLAGDNQYYVTYEHSDYRPFRSDTIDLTGKEAETITLNIALEKQDNPAPGVNPAVVKPADLPPQTSAPPV